VDPALAEVVLAALQREPARRIQTAGELERRLLTWVIASTRTPEDTDVGLFVRSLFPAEAAAEEDTDPVGPLQLVSGVGPTASRPQVTARSAGQRSSVADPEGRLLQQTLPSGSEVPVADDDALAPTRTPAHRRTSAATAPGRQSVVTSAPAEEMRVIAAQLGARRRRAIVALVGLAVVVGVGGIAFVAGRTDPRTQPSEPPVRAPSSPAVPVAEVRPPAAPAQPRNEVATTPPAAAPGFLQMKAQPWGKLYIDGKFAGDVEGVRRFPLAPGSHTVRLINGKKARSWDVDIQSGKTEPRQHSFIED
jgi:serine/threonine-protein kinase